MRKKIIIVALVLLFNLAGCKEPQKVDVAENGNIIESIDTQITFTDIIQMSSVICIGKVVDIRDSDKTTQIANVAITREFKGDIEEMNVDLSIEEVLKPGYSYVFFLEIISEEEKKNISYEILSIASLFEQGDDGITILYDEAIKLNVDYQDIGRIAELNEYIQNRDSFQKK